jgi:hypothetical protein
MSANIPAKDVIYIDVDDEITAIIDKVRDSQSKIVALVLPKRATTLQSIVNMKLLKRSADTDNKHLVLITAEAGLLPLAANVGLYVAKNLQSKPEVPDAPRADALPEDGEEAISMDDAPKLSSNNPITGSLNSQAPIGDLAKGSLPPTALDESIDLDNTTPAAKPGVVPPAKGGFGGKAPKGKRNKKLSVPNFDKFRLWIILGAVAAILLIVGIVIAAKSMPRANVSLKTDSTAVSTNLDLVLNTNAMNVNPEAGVIPAKSQQVQKTLTQQAPATGEKNNGKKASGSITITNCSEDDESVSLPAGTGFSAGGQTYVSNSSVTVPPSNFTGGGNCKNDGRATVSVTAQNQGGAYNADTRNYSIAGSPSDLSATGTQMSGGSDEIIKVVQASDIESAKQKIAAQDANAVKQQLKSQLGNAGLYSVEATFNPGDPKTTTNVNAGDQADSVTVTQVVTYTMLGVKQADLKQVIANAVEDHIDKDKQSIIDYGLGKANFTTQNPGSGSVALSTTAIAGPDLKTNELKTKIAGMKSGEAKKLLKENPGVTDVTIDYSPFWVTKIPGDATKINLTIQEPEVKTKAN